MGKSGIFSTYCVSRQLPAMQHAAAAVRVGDLAAHLAELGRLHVAAAVEAEHAAGLGLGNGPHHALLRVAALGLPLLLHLLARAGQVVISTCEWSLMGMARPTSCMPCRSALNGG